MLLYNFKNLGKAIPFLEIGCGILVTDLDPDGFGSSFNFSPQIGVGLLYEIAHNKFI